VIAEEKRRTVWRSALLWINFPRSMWSVRRGPLHRLAEARLIALESEERDADCSLRAAPNLAGRAEREASVIGLPKAGLAEPGSRRGRGLGAKRVAFEAALVERMRAGDLRLFSGDERVRNAAAYQAAASLVVPLSRRAAWRYVVQALHRIRPESAPGDSRVHAVVPEAV
jgi:hypothetical protein